jgi:2-hydroxy-6-oxonona-2,4-dienedioate hydrolase
LEQAMSLAAFFLSVVLVAIVVASALIFFFYTREIGLARAEARRGGRIANTIAGPIEYAEKGAGIPLLSIHGAGGGYDQGLANVAGLVGEGVRVIAPSRFGYLGTPIPVDTSDAAQANAHAALLAALNIDRAIVVGISAGARSAAELALRHPDKVAALILIVPGTYAPEGPVAIEGSRASALLLWLVNTGADFVWWVAEKIAPSILIRFLGVEPRLFASAPPAEHKRVMQIVRNVEPLSLRFLGINVDSKLDRSRPSWEGITAPTLVISARDDLFNTAPAAEFAASTIPNAGLIVYETGGHLLVGRQQDAREAVKNFITKHVDVSMLRPPAAH